MQELIILYRLLQLYTHNAHNLVARSPFLADHEFLGELYGTYESAYDSLVERVIGLGQEIDLTMVQVLAVEKLKMYPANNMTENADCFNKLLQLEKEARVLAANMIKSGQYTEGTKNLLAQLCDDSEARSYKMGQRVKK